MTCAALLSSSLAGDLEGEDVTEDDLNNPEFMSELDEHAAAFGDDLPSVEARYADSSQIRLPSPQPDVWRVLQASTVQASRS
jgi:hypothetical protein